MENVCEIVRQLESDYNAGNTVISKYVTFDMAETLNKIDAYLNSVHTKGSQDSLGRDKPFFNIVTAARNIWYRATDIDRKNIKIRAGQQNQTVLSFAAQMILTQWMQKSAFGAYLNEWGRTLATYCSAVTKFVEVDGELSISVIPWNRIICDPIEFDGNVKVEILEYTPAQLRKIKAYDKETVDSLIESLGARETLSKQKKDNKDGYIKVYEVHGELPLELITGKESDSEKYEQQMHVVSFITKGRGSNKEYKDFTLYKGREKKDPYQIDHLIKEDGRTLGIGAVESLFEAQWMVNHTAKQIKDTLDFASLLILQTADGALTGRNVLNSLITGDILIHAENQPLTQLNNQHDITQIQAFSSMWQNQGKEQAATPDALAGITPPSGTAYRLQQLVTNQAQSLFELMTENKGLGIEKMLREHIIPFIKTKIDTSEEITAILDSNGITQYDSMYVPNEAIRRANSQMVNTVLSGQEASQVNPQDLRPEIQKELSTLGNQRFLKPSDTSDKTWKEALKDFEWQVNVDITHENEDVQDALTTLQSTFQTIVSLAGRPMTPDEKFVFNQIMSKSGTVSPLQLGQTTPAQQMPQGGVSSSANQIIKQA